MDGVSLQHYSSKVEILVADLPLPYPCRSPHRRQSQPRHEHRRGYSNLYLSSGSGVVQRPAMALREVQSLG